MTSIFRYRLHFPHLAKYRNIAHFKRLTFNLHLYAFPCSAYHFPRQQAQLRDDDADHRSGHLHGEQAARPQERGDHTDIRKDNRPEED